MTRQSTTGAGSPPPNPTIPPRPSLSQLLRRKDVWRGHSQTFVEQAHWSTGHANLDQALLHNGWPLSSLTEICQGAQAHTEWLLLGPAIRHACAQGGYVILLNPPAEPYVPALIQQRINLDQLVLVQAQSRQDFVASLIEILQAPICQMLLGWEPAQPLNYAELRKCQLATASHPGLCLLFRQQRHQQQSSPASLRLSSRLTADYLELQVFKQRGKRHNAPVQIALPADWQALALHNQLGSLQPAAEQPDNGPRSARILTFGKQDSLL